MNNPKITYRLDQLQRGQQTRHEVTVDNLTAELDAACIAMKDDKGASAAVSAIMAEAKLHGLIVDKSEAKHTSSFIGLLTELEEELKSKPMDQLIDLVYLQLIFLPISNFYASDQTWAETWPKLHFIG